METGNAFVKDAFNEYLVHGKTSAVNPANTGTKAALHYAIASSRRWHTDDLSSPLR